MKELYVVLFEGKVRERESKREVKSRLMDCFNMGQAAIDRLFSGQRVIVFRSEDRAKTDDFAKRFAETGALCRIEVDFREEAEKESPIESPQRPEEEHRAQDVHWEDDGAVSSLGASPLLPLWQSFAGPRGEWYAERFKLFSRSGRTAFAPSWNWGAFLFGIVWLIYRKMYGLAILFFGISAAGIVIPGGSLAVSFFFGAFANFLYFLHVKKKVDAIISASDQVDPNQAMEAAGGVNPISKVLAIFIIMMGVMAFIGTYLFDLSELAPHIQ